MGHLFQKVFSANDIENLEEKQVLWRVTHPSIKNPVRLRGEKQQKEL